MKRSLLILLSCLFLVALTACGKSENISEEEARQVIENEYYTLIQYDQNRDDQNPLTVVLKEGFEATDLEISNSENGYLVNCTVSNYDVADAFNKLNQEVDETDLTNYANLLAENVKNSEKKSYDEQFVITKTEDGYEVQFTEEQLDEAIGGLISYYNQLGQSGETK